MTQTGSPQSPLSDCARVIFDPRVRTVVAYPDGRVFDLAGNLAAEIDSAVRRGDLPYGTAFEVYYQ